MNQKQAKRIRKMMRENPVEPLILLRNEIGSRSEKLSKKGVLRNLKKLYHQGKLKTKK